MLSLRENLKLTRNILDSNALVFIVPAVIAALLMEVARLAIEPISPASKLTAELVNVDLSTFQSILGPLVVYIFVQNIFQAIMNAIGWGTITVAAIGSLEGRVVSLGGCIKVAFSSIIPLGIAGIIALELSTVGYVLLIAPGVLLTTLFSMTTPVLLFESKGVFDSLKQSYLLVRRSVWATFTIYSVAWIITFVAQIIISSMINSFGDLGFYGRFLFSAAKAFVDPVVPIALTVHFYSLKTIEKKPITNVNV
jgi:hypothetical protein